MSASVREACKAFLRKPMSVTFKDCLDQGARTGAASVIAQQLMDEMMSTLVPSAIWVPIHVRICNSAAMKPYARLDAWAEEARAFFRGENEGDESLREAMELIAAYKLGVPA
jgi:hypothetical protein